MHVLEANSLNKHEAKIFRNDIIRLIRNKVSDCSAVLHQMATSWSLRTIGSRVVYNGQSLAKI